LADESRWRPEWIQPNYLKADALGRIRHALVMSPEGARPKEWQRHLDALQTRLSEADAFILSTLPAIGESARLLNPLAADPGELKKYYAQFESESTEENLVTLAPLIYSYGCPEETVHALHLLMADMRGKLLKAEEKGFQLVTTVASHVATQYQDVSLADKISDLCLEAARSCANPNAVRECVLRIIEGAAADTDRDRAKRGMAKRVEAIAFSLPAEMLSELLLILRLLQSFDNELASYLGRAVAGARLGRRMIAA